MLASQVASSVHVAIKSQCSANIISTCGGFAEPIQNWFGESLKSSGFYSPNNIDTKKPCKEPKACFRSHRFSFAERWFSASLQSLSLLSLGRNATSFFCFIMEFRPSGAIANIPFWHFDQSGAIAKRRGEISAKRKNSATEESSKCWLHK